MNKGTEPKRWKPKFSAYKSGLHAESEMVRAESEMVHFMIVISKTVQ